MLRPGARHYFQAAAKILAVDPVTKICLPSYTLLNARMRKEESYEKLHYRIVACYLLGTDRRNFSHSQNDFQPE
jgi:hypothetical protein